MAAVFTVMSTGKFCQRQRGVGWERSVPFLGKSEVMGRPHLWGFADEGESMAKCAYFSF